MEKTYKEATALENTEIKFINLMEYLHLEPNDFFFEIHSLLGTLIFI